MNSGDMACCVYVVFEKNKESPMYCCETHVHGLLHVYPFYPFFTSEFNAKESTGWFRF